MYTMVCGPHTWAIIKVNWRAVYNNKWLGLQLRSVARCSRIKHVSQFPDNTGATCSGSILSLLEGKMLEKLSISTGELRKACLPWVKSTRIHSGGFWKALSLTAFFLPLNSPTLAQLLPSYSSPRPRRFPPTHIYYCNSQLFFKKSTRDYS